MSLASILRPRLSSSVAPLISWAARSRSVSGIHNCNTSIIPSLMSGGSNNISSSRSVWSEVIRQVPSDDPNKAGQLTFEDPDLADSRMLRAVRAEGMLLFIALVKHNFYDCSRHWVINTRRFLSFSLNEGMVLYLVFETVFRKVDL